MRRTPPHFLTVLLLGVVLAPFVSAQEMQEMAMKDAAAKAGAVAKVEEKMDPAGLEFFEKNVRPILTERCYKCHSAAESTSKGGLLLDSRAAMLAGGDQGPAVVPNNLKKSLLIVSIHQTDPDLSMPPRKACQCSQLRGCLSMHCSLPSIRRATSSCSQGEACLSGRPGAAAKSNASQRLAASASMVGGAWFDMKR